MNMSEGEIAASYRQAKNKTSQIGILAELNLTDKKTIKEILVKTGEIQTEKKTENVQKETKTPIPAAVRTALVARLLYLQQHIDDYTEEMHEINKFIQGAS